MKKLVLIDAYALIFRAYYAFIRTPRVNSKGENTSAVFGFVNTLDDILRTFSPDYAAVAFDPAGGTFRHEAFPAYKAQREATPEDIKWAVPHIKEIIAAHGIPMLEVPGYEADDVIGTLALKAAAEGVEVEMITPDKDYAQLVRPGVTMCRPGNGAKAMERLGPAEVCAKYGLESPGQVIDMLGLMGDAADNIPGCPGVGEKTAVKLLAEYKNIETLLGAAPGIKGAIGRKLVENAEQVRFSRFLATIRTDVPLHSTGCLLEDGEHLDFNRLTPAAPQTERLAEIYTQLEFRTLVAKLRGETAATAAPPSARRKKAAAPVERDLFDPVDESGENSAPSGEYLPADGQAAQNVPVLDAFKPDKTDYNLVENEEDARRLSEILLTSNFFAFDTETTSVDAIDAELVGMSFSTAPGTAWYVAVPRETAEARRMAAIFKEALEHPKILKVGQNMKYDITVLSAYGVEVSGPLFDTMLAHYVVQPELYHNLDALDRQ